MPVHLFAIVALLCSAQVLAADGPSDLYVSPAGHDGWSGRLPEPNAHKNDGPLATLDGARLKVRELLRHRPEPRRPIVVTIAGGNYFLSQPVNFTAEDSGQGDAPVIYRAKAGDWPVISAGVPIGGWRVQPDGRWVVTLEEVRAGRWDFAQLFVHGERRMRPRSPKSGYYHIAARVPPAGDPKDPKKRKAGERPGDDRFRYAERDIRADWRNRDAVEIVTFHPWYTSMLRMAELDPANKLIVFTGGTRSDNAWGQLAGGMRYFADNVAEALDEPGEWYLDKPTGTLTYIPKPGETPEKTSVIAPCQGHVIGFHGEAKAGATVHDIRFGGLTFAHANWLTPKEGSSIPQAAVSVGGAVTAVGTERLAFEWCLFTQNGGYGLDIGAGCRDVTVEACRFLDLGAGGVKIGTPGLPADDAQLTQRVRIRDNTIAHLGRIHPAAVGVWIGQAADVTVEHNDIYDLYYTCVSSGWVWGYGKTANRNIRIQGNDMHHYGQAVLSDMGGVYTLGASPDSVIEGNRMHDCDRDKYGGWGVYYDEGSSGWTARNNLLYRLHDGGFHQHYGAENVFENNILIDAKEVQWGPSRIDSPATPGKVVDRRAITFERNIISGWGAASVVRNETMSKLIQDHADKLKVNHNLYWNHGKEVKFGNIDFEEWQKRGLDKGSRIGDPKLPKEVDIRHFQMPHDSPAMKIGFKPFDISGAGRLNAEPADLDAVRWPRWFPPAGAVRK